MTDELEILKAENSSFKKDMAHLESELKKRATELTKKKSKCDNATLELKKKNLKLQEERTKNQIKTLKFERKISELKEEISELKRNTNPSLAEIMSEVSGQLKKASLNNINSHLRTPETPYFVEEEVKKLDLLRSKFKEFRLKDDKPDA